LNPEKRQIIEEIKTLPLSDLVDMLCPICHTSFGLGEEKLKILRRQKYIFCPQCSEKVYLNKILELSYNTILLNHRKIMEDAEKQKMENNNSKLTHKPSSSQGE
jgi:DNA-directed RNA polymerase subunit RPC12/RpoP